MRISGYRAFWDTPTLQAVERAMGRAVARHKLLAHNLANANTPNFIRFDLPEGESAPTRAQQRAVEAGVVPLRTSDPRHIALPEPVQPRGAAPIPQPTPMRTDGNTIDPEYELAQLAENELRYALLARIANAQIQGLRNAIREGKP
ncbi:MAG: flagellar basal body rod protein FlgB [Armatimonadota bacterium]|nr:flagellar basal body rod protein FlgB [Armatimonadota bacterium]MDW8106631.1 flagellar basal body rod protein FlgB [Armatimonadota bacterium]